MPRTFSTNIWTASFIYYFTDYEATSFPIAQWRFIFHLYLNEFDLKSINQEFLLFLKLLKKHSIQYFTIKLWITNWGRCYLWIQILTLFVPRARRSAHPYGKLPGVWAILPQGPCASLTLNDFLGRLRLLN